LGQIKDHCTGKRIHYYTGRDPAIMQTFATDQSCLLHVSQGNPRRQVQLSYIQRLLQVPEVPDHATIIKEFSGTDLTMEEAALVIRVASTLSDDYLLPRVEVRFAQ